MPRSLAILVSFPDYESVANSLLRVSLTIPFSLWVQEKVLSSYVTNRFSLWVQEKTVSSYATTSFLCVLEKKQFLVLLLTGFLSVSPIQHQCLPTLLIHWNLLVLFTSLFFSIGFLHYYILVITLPHHQLTLCQLNHFMQVVTSTLPFPLDFFSTPSVLLINLAHCTVNSLYASCYISASCFY